MPGFEIAGIVPIIPTSFTADDRLDLQASAALLRFALDAGVCAVCLPAYASEFYKLREAERARVGRRSDQGAGRTASGDRPGESRVGCRRGRVGPRVPARGRSGDFGCGAEAVRLAGARPASLLRRMLEAIAIPLVIQDFNPGGATVSLDFVKTLHRSHPHFRYLKLEEPLMAARVQISGAAKPKAQ